MVASPSLTQCAAVVTTRGWISVPLHEAKPLTPTVLGQAHAPVIAPPTMGATVGSIAALCAGALSGALAQAWHASAANHPAQSELDERLGLRRTRPTFRYGFIGVRLIRERCRACTAESAIQPLPR
jgi:hypothetical protein